MRHQKFTVILFCLTGLYGGAQQGAVAMTHYVFQQFSRGSVKEKTGAVTEQTLNYNVLTGEMIFDAGGKYLAIAHPGEVDTVIIDNRKFVPVKDHFYEWIGGREEPLFIEFTCTIREPGAQTGFGTTTTTSTTSLSSLVKTGGAYELKLPDDFKVIPGHNYWIRKEGQYYKVNSAAQLAKLYPGKKNVITEWVKKNNTRFSSPDEVKKLVEGIQEAK